MRPKPAQSRPVYLLALQPARGRDGIRGLRALLKTAWRRHGLRALEVRELRPDSKRAKRLPKSASKTDEPPTLSRRQVTCIRKDSQMQKDDVFPSKYLKHPDLQGKPTVMVIESAVLETLKSPEGKTQDRVVLYFAGAKKSAAQRDELRRRRGYLRRRHRRLAGLSHRAVSQQDANGRQDR
jgi:hypothetical protein